VYEISSFDRIQNVSFCKKQLSKENILPIIRGVKLEKKMSNLQDV